MRRGGGSPFGRTQILEGSGVSNLYRFCGTKGLFGESGCRVLFFGVNFVDFPCRLRLRLDEMMRHGVPAQNRGEIWFEITDAEERGVREQGR